MTGFLHKWQFVTISLPNISQRKGRSSKMYLGPGPNTPGDYVKRGKEGVREESAT